MAPKRTGTALARSAVKRTKDPSKALKREQKRLEEREDEKVWWDRVERLGGRFFDLAQEAVRNPELTRAAGGALAGIGAFYPTFFNFEPWLRRFGDQALTVVRVTAVPMIKAFLPKLTLFAAEWDTAEAFPNLRFDVTIPQPEIFLDETGKIKTKGTVLSDAQAIVFAEKQVRRFILIGGATAGAVGITFAGKVIDQLGGIVPG